jgi:DNA-binding transcriptional regulator YdaS (Cro superfamily)
MLAMGMRDTYQKTLVRACLVVGDETALAGRLGVPLPSLVDWLLGERPVPADVFLGATDIVLEANRQQVQENRAFLEEVRRRHRASKR